MSTLNSQSNPHSVERREQENTAESPSRTETCPDCGGRIRSAHSERFCEDCYAVVESDTINHEKERTVKTPDDKFSNTRYGGGSTNLHHDKGLSTTFYTNSTSDWTESASPRRKEQIRRIKKLDNKTLFENKQERYIGENLPRIRLLIDRLGGDYTMKEQACSIYQSAVRADLLQGRSTSGLIAASVFMASRALGNPLSMDETIEESPASEEKMRLMFKTINRELDIQTVIITPDQHLEKALEAVNYVENEVDPETVAHFRIACYDFISEVMEQNIHIGGKPGAVAGAAVYVVGTTFSFPVVQKEVAEQVDMSATTLRNWKRKFEGSVNPDEIKTEAAAKLD